MSSVSHQTDAQVSPSGRAYADDTTRTTDPSLGDLVAQLSTQVPDLIRSELRLAQAEVTAKGKRAGIGIGMFSAAGLLAFFGLAFLLTTVALLLDLFLPGWAAALVVAVVLLAGAGVAALLGKKKVAEAAPPTPERTIESVKEDIAAVKGATSRGAHR
jgi:uncharacterized membrane protein YqjE